MGAVTEKMTLIDKGGEGVQEWSNIAHEIYEKILTST